MKISADYYYYYYCYYYYYYYYYYLAVVYSVSEYTSSIFFFEKAHLALLLMIGILVNQSRTNAVGSNTGLNLSILETMRFLQIM